jgi:hypothetical protein
VTTRQYRVIFGKKDEVVEGPDDADIVLSIAAADAGLDPQVAYMRGKLKMAGPAGPFFELLKSGEIGPVLQRLSTR